MYRAPPHVPRVLLYERPLACVMHHARVIPDHQIALVLSFDAEHVLVLRHVRQQSLNQLAQLGLGDPLEGLLR